MTSTVGLRRPTSRTWNPNAQPRPGLSRNLRLDNRTYRTVQSVDYGAVLTSSSGGAVYYAKFFSFGDLDQVSSLASIFDQYRIDEIEVWASTVGSTLTGLANLYGVVDYDDANNLSSLAAARQYSNCMEVPIDTGIYFSFRPHTALSAAGSGQPNVPFPWTNSATQGQPAYGVKFAMGSSSVTRILYVNARFHLTFRNIV
jgi:hypothetical protein